MMGLLQQYVFLAVLWWVYLAGWPINTTTVCAVATLVFAYVKVGALVREMSILRIARHGAQALSDVMFFGFLVLSRFPFWSMCATFWTLLHVKMGLFDGTSNVNAGYAIYVSPPFLATLTVVTLRGCFSKMIVHRFPRTILNRSSHLLVNDVMWLMNLAGWPISTTAICAVATLVFSYVQVGALVREMSILRIAWHGAQALWGVMFIGFLVFFRFPFWSMYATFWTFLSVEMGPFNEMSNADAGFMIYVSPLFLATLTAAAMHGRFSKMIVHRSSHLPVYHQ